MQKPVIIAVILLSIFVRKAVAQTTPATSPKPAPATKPQQPSTTKTTRPSTSRNPATPLTLKTPKEKASYAVGMNYGTGLRKQAVDIDPAIAARGLRDGVALLLRRDNLHRGVDVHEVAGQLVIDVYVIVEAPDNVSAAALALAVGVTGALAHYKTTVLLTTDEVDEAAKKSTGLGYRAPGH